MQLGKSVSLRCPWFVAVRENMPCDGLTSCSGRPWLAGIGSRPSATDGCKSSSLTLPAVFLSAPYYRALLIPAGGATVCQEAPSQRAAEELRGGGGPWSIGA